MAWGKYHVSCLPRRRPRADRRESESGFSGGGDGGGERERLRGAVANSDESEAKRVVSNVEQAVGEDSQVIFDGTRGGQAVGEFREIPAPVAGGGEEGGG